MHSILRCRIEALFDRLNGHLFDFWNDVETEGQLWPHQFGTFSASLSYSKRYQPTHLSVTKRVFQHLPVKINEYNFYDFGHGKGRMLIIAAMNGAKHCYGVEFSPLLFDISKLNIEKIVAKQSSFRQKFTLFFGDAVEIGISTQKNIYFFYNPFSGIILRNVLENILSSTNFSDQDIFVFVNLQEPFLMELLGLQLVAKVDHLDRNRVIHYFKALIP